jgi:hypothetical protein
MPIDDFPHAEDLQNDAFTSEIADWSPSNADTLRDEIALRAYLFWEARGGQDGSPEEDWFRAEREVRNERAVEEAPKEPKRETSNRAREKRLA